MGRIEKLKKFLDDNYKNYQGDGKVQTFFCRNTAKEYTSSDKNGGFSNLCGNNSNDIKTPPKDYGSKTTQSKKILYKIEINNT